MEFAVAADVDADVDASVAADAAADVVADAVADAGRIRVKRRGSRLRSILSRTRPGSVRNGPPHAELDDVAARRKNARRMPAIPAAIPFGALPGAPPLLAAGGAGAIDDYLPVLIMLGFGVVFAVGSLTISWLLGEKGRKLRAKDTPYECGMPIQSHAHERFGVKFYLVAVLFILFDVEIVFMYPWAVSWGHPDPNRGGAPAMGLLLAEVAVFVAILVAGWWYVVKKGVLEWHKED
ncbi:MAG: NAD(P)H-quinone oxidoreductase subunit 3, chloroplastic [Planctomycetes bacterium]|nr:NAD(P)H-quinone oxidoreductase subunit 3, chloroplastic [Planctomycetota bacterium]